MITTETDRGYRIVFWQTFAGVVTNARLIQESSAIGDYEDSMDNPGSSYLWVGEVHHLNREEVSTLIAFMQHWLDHGRLPAPEINGARN